MRLTIDIEPPRRWYPDDAAFRAHVSAVLRALADRVESSGSDALLGVIPGQRSWVDCDERSARRARRRPSGIRE